MTRLTRNYPAFNEFIHERERNPASDPSIRLFDEIILAKKARGRPAFSTGFSRLSTLRGAGAFYPGGSNGSSSSSSSSGGGGGGGFTASGSATGATAGRAAKVPSYLTDTSDHIWRTASVPVPSAKFQGDYKSIVTRVPLRLDPALMKEPRAIQGVPRPSEQGKVKKPVRKQVASMVGPPPGFRSQESEPSK